MMEDKLAARVRAYLGESAEVKRAVAGATSPFDVAAPNGPVIRAASLPGAPAAISAPAASRTVEAIVAASRLIADAFRSGGKLLLCGNGGSAADCQHMAAELTGLLRKDVERPGLPALALTTDTSFLTAYANDRDFAQVFARQVQAIGRPGDVLLAISTSGNSPNVLRAVQAARSAGIATIALTGEGGRLSGLADVSVSVPSGRTSHIQEAHLAIEHVMCELVEELLAGRARAAEAGAV